MNALANKEVGKYINEFFCSSFQKVATFRIVGKQKQGGNVATYFCAPDGRVLHAVAGPVDAKTLLKVQMPNRNGFIPQQLEDIHDIKKRGCRLGHCP